MSPTEDHITGWFRQQSRYTVDRVPIGIGDDMAQISLGDAGSVLITTDMLLDGTHFDLKTATLEQVGYKAMAVSLSDCAAMATVPVGAVAAVALPPDFGEPQLKGLHAGIALAANKYDCPLVGGDITAWRHGHPFAVSVAMLSRTGATAPIRRDGARDGDVICVTGTLGGSRQRKHLEFEPRVKEALDLARTVTVNAMIDISDGLSTDLNRICCQSGVGATIEASAIPISEEARVGAEPLTAALNEGEDFELLFTLASGQWSALRESWSGSVPITPIGRITAMPGMQIVMPDGHVTRLAPAGYEHLGHRA